MTDEEMAEEWVKQEYPTLQITKVAQRYIKAFLAGLKAGRPQWHDLRKDPNDLPKDDKEYVVKVKEYGGISVYIGRYWKKEKMFTGYYLQELVVIKWKEIE